MTYPSPYIFRDQYPAIYELGRAGATSMEVYRDGELVPVTSGTLVILSPTGASVQTPAVSVVGGVATATVAAIAQLGEGYREVWTLLVEGTTFVKRRDAAVCRSPLYAPLADVDLIAALPDLARDLGANAGSFQGYIDQAWGRMLRKLRNAGEMPYIVVQSSALYDPLYHLTLHLVYMSWVRNGADSTWRELADFHHAEYKDAWSSMSYEVDRDQDGVSDGRDRDSGGKGQIVYPAGAPDRIRNRRRVW